jgi:tetratricopeptide (TPR) repeat protein
VRGRRSVAALEKASGKRGTAPFRREWALLIVALAGLTACSTAPAKPAIATAAAAAQRLADADALLRAGCFDCLLDAYRIYDGARAIPAVSTAATTGAARAALLLAIRERELGTEDSGYLIQANALASGVPAAQQSVGPLLEIADALPSRVTGGGRQVTDDRELNRMQQGYRNRDAWLTRLRSIANDDGTTAYVWMAFNCAYGTSTPPSIEEWLAAVPAWRETPLLAFKRATCGTFDGAALEQLLSREPRFVEVNYFLGLRAMFSGRLDEADERLRRAYAWRARWPAVTNALGSLSLTAEEFQQAIEFFDRTLAVAPEHPEGLLGKIRSLTYLQRHDEAIATVDRLLALEHWYVGDARYWRALNEAQLGRNEEAWTDIEAAARLLVNAEVPKLAGLIAYRLHHLDVAQAKFEESHGRDRLDCETTFYLGTVLSDERLWSKSATALVDAAACLEAAQTHLTEEIATIRASSDPPERKDKQIARRERQIADARRMLATSWFNTAVAYFNLEQPSDARAFAEKVEADEQFGARARELLARLGK